MIILYTYQRQFKFNSEQFIYFKHSGNFLISFIPFISLSHSLILYVKIVIKLQICPSDGTESNTVLLSMEQRKHYLRVNTT
jgi:hypothetical protein